MYCICVYTVYIYIYIHLHIYSHANIQLRHNVKEQRLRNGSCHRQIESYGDSLLPFSCHVHVNTCHKAIKTQYGFN